MILKLLSCQLYRLRLTFIGKGQWAALICAILHRPNRSHQHSPGKKAKSAKTKHQLILPASCLCRFNKPVSSRVIATKLLSAFCHNLQMSAMLSYPKRPLLCSNPSKADKGNSISPCNVGFDLRTSIGRSAWTGAALSQCRDVSKFDRPCMPG